jgi:hypothetical protein
MSRLILVLFVATILLAACAIPVDTDGTYAYDSYPEYALGRVW